MAQEHRAPGGSHNNSRLFYGSKKKIDLKTTRREHISPHEAKNTAPYSFVVSYSKQVIDLPPFPVGNGGYQGQ